MNAIGFGHATVLSINIGAGREAPFEGPRKTTGIDKRPARAAVTVARYGFTGDEQVDTVHHGGLDQAVYAYAAEDLAWWSAQLDREMKHGVFGENLTLSGLDVNGALIGDCWRVGTALLQITSPRIPCRMFAGWMAEEHWMKRFADADRPGAYLRVLEPGRIAPGDTVEVVDRTTPSVTVAQCLRAYYGDWDLLPALIDAPGIAARWSAMAKTRQATGTACRLPDNPVSSADG